MSSSPEPDKPPRKRAPRKAAQVAEVVEVAPPAPSPVSVLVPWRPNPERRRLWDFMRPRWEAYGWQIVEGRCPGKVWCKAAAVADALSRAEGSTLVIADADVWCDGVGDAVAVVAAGTKWAMPHYRVCRLTRPATEDVLGGAGWPTKRTTITYAQPPYPGRPGGGMVVLGRETYERIPLDPRFLGWGHEDESWALALGTLAGRPWRGLEDMWHLWHEPQVRQSRTIGSPANLALYRRYGLAARDPVRMRALLGEIR